MGILLAAAVLMSTAVLPAVPAAAAEPAVIEDFETITELAQNPVFTYRPTTESTDPAKAYARIENGALHFGKTVGGAHELRVDLASAIGDMKDYTVSFDYTGAFWGSSMNIKLGACFAFQNAADTSVGHPDPPALEDYRHVLFWWNGASSVQDWDRTDMTTYDLSRPARIDLTVENQEKVDVYINGELVEEDLLYRQSPFTQLHLQMNSGVRGEVVLDNLMLTEGTNPPPAPLPQDVLYTQDFSEISDISEDSVLQLNPGTTDAVAEVTDGELRFGKTEGGTGKEAWFSAEFGPYLTDAEDYLVSFDFRPALSAGGSFNLFLGGCIVVRPQTDNTVILGWHDGNAWHEEDKTKYDISDGANLKLVVHGRSAMDVYINNILAIEGVPQRGTNSFTKLNFEMSKNTKGDIYLDNLLLTTDTTIEEEEPPEPEIENAVDADDTPVVGTPDVAKEDFDLYLAIGQSNMSGRAPLEAEDRISIPNAYLFNADGEWETAQAQYYNGKWQGMNRYSDVQKTDGSLQGLSPAFYFAKLLAEQVGNEQTKIGIISNARGDTSLAQWQKGYETVGSREDYDLYEKSIARAKAAMETGTLKGIIWHQGGADVSTNPADYIKNFQQLAADLRADLGIPDLPIIIGEISGFAKAPSTSQNRMNFNRNIIAKLPDAVENCWAVSSANTWHVGDWLHFDAPSNRQLGKLYGEVALEHVYGITPPQYDLIPLQNATASNGAESAAIAADGVADLHAWDDPSAYWTGENGAIWEAEFGEELTLNELRSYFYDPYNTVVQYKVYLRQNGNWNQVIDNSSIEDYHTVAIDGAVVDTFDSVIADAVRIEIAGLVNYPENPIDIIGCHEFEVYTSDTIQGTRVSFRGYSGSAEIAVGDADTLELTAASASGIKDIKVYANGILLQTLTEAPYLLDISGLGISRTELRAVATANDGITAEATLSLTIAGLLDHALVEDSTFETEVGTTLKSGISLYPQRGYVKVEQIDEAHGNSLLVGIETVNEEYTSGNLPYINIPLGGIADEFSLFCDLYVDVKDTSGDKRLTLYQASGNEMVLLRFRDQMTISNSNTNAVDYETGRWYSFRIDIDVANHTADVYRDGAQIGTIALGANMTAANYIRLYGPRNDTVPSYTAMDNLRVVKYFRIPSILSVDEDNVVSASAESFTVQLDDVLFGSSVNAESVWLQDNMGVKTSVKDAKWSETDKSITVTPARKLASGSNYNFVLGGTVELSAGVPIRYPVRAAFRTEAEGVEIQTAQLSEESGMKKAVVTLYNATQTAAEGFVVMTLWNGDEFCGMAVQPCDPAAGETQEVILTHEAPAGATAELVVYDSLSLPQMLCGSVYRSK